jgi:hypothetical protein
VATIRVSTGELTFPAWRSRGGRRASCHKYQADQLRLLLAALAYALMVQLRRLGVRGTELAQACTAIIRARLLETGAAIVRYTRRVRLFLASQHPLQHV